MEARGWDLMSSCTVFYLSFDRICHPHLLLIRLVLGTGIILNLLLETEFLNQPGISQIHLDLLATKPQDSCLHLPSLGITGMCYGIPAVGTWLFTALLHFLVGLKILIKMCL